MPPFNGGRRLAERIWRVKKCNPSQTEHRNDVYTHTQQGLRVVSYGQLLLYSAMKLVPTLLLLLLWVQGCQLAPSVPPPALLNKADSLAWMAWQSYGGPEVWARVPYLTFEFGGRVEGDTSRAGMRRHWWDRASGAYRLEVPRADTLYTILFNVNTQEGTAYRDGVALEDSLGAAWVERAYGMYINDVYWLLSPTKWFDPGVERVYVPDSSDTRFEVFRVSFGEVGLTPGDRYWVYMDPKQERVEGWKFILQHQDPATTTPVLVRRTGYETFETRWGTANIATMHVRDGADRVLYTDRVTLPESLPATLFTQP